MKKLFFILIVCFSINGFGQVKAKFLYDCSDTLKGEEVYKPKIDGFFNMVYTNLSSPNDWMNQDTIFLYTTSNENMNDGMCIISKRPPIKRKVFGEMSFGKLIIFDSGEYGESWDEEVYYASIEREDDVLILRDKFWWNDKGRGKKIRFKYKQNESNCAMLIRLNPSKKKNFPKQMSEEDRKAIITNTSYNK